MPDVAGRIACLGLDLGTSSLKALVLDAEGRTLSLATAGYPLDTPHPDWSESDPTAWWAAAVEATAQALHAAGQPVIVGIGVAGQMHGVVVARADGTPLRPAILWSDGRATRFHGRYDALPAETRRRLANPFMAGAAGVTLAWLAEHEAAVLRRARWALQPKDWLRTRLVAGSPVTDPSDASATLLWDVPADTFARDVAVTWGIDLRLLPAVRPSGSVAGPLTGAAARALGLEPGIPVAVGAGDTAAAALGTGFVTPGGVQLTLGTGAQAVAMRASASVDHTGRTHLYRAATDGRWYAMAAVQNAGLALDWARRALGAEWMEVYASLPDDALAPDAPLFIPHVTQERSFQPYPGPGAGWVGVNLHHGRADLLASALEGVAFGIRLALDALPGAHGTAIVRLAGGGSVDPGYRQLLADVLGRDLETVEGHAATARGAALLGGVAAGWWPSVDAAARAVSPSAPGATTRPRRTAGRGDDVRRMRWLDAVRRNG